MSKLELPDVNVLVAIAWPICGAVISEPLGNLCASVRHPHRDHLITVPSIDPEISIKRDDLGRVVHLR